MTDWAKINRDLKEMDVEQHCLRLASMLPTDQQLNACHFRLHKYIAGPKPVSKWACEVLGYDYSFEAARRSWGQEET